MTFVSLAQGQPLLTYSRCPGAGRGGIGAANPAEPDRRAVRERILDAYLFASIEQVQLLTQEWLIDYNTERPHDSLGRVPPLTYLPRPNTDRRL